ncbi:hypothetical protein ACFE04_012184 [Oxalis oulophora]
MNQDDGGRDKHFITQVVAASFVGALVAVGKLHRQQKSKILDKDENVIPRLDRTESGRVGKLERFSHYVVRQMGIEDASDCPQVCKLVYEYLRKSKGCEHSIYDYFANEAQGDSLYVKLIEEFDRCILTYFAFHWNQASFIINQVLDDESDQQSTKLKNIFMAATRKKRFENVHKNLKVTRLFSTLVEEMKAMGRDTALNSSDVMVPMAHRDRSPVLLLMGGGMGAGKSTVLKDIMKEPFWSGAAANAVVVEADAFKETDVIYRALNSRGHHNDMLQTSELVHQSSTNAASSLLVTALNEGRDVIMDGTLSWEPFVEQTIAMARNVHKHRYRMGVGYKVEEDGTLTENYWEQVTDGETDDGFVDTIKPYRIELVGVVCDAYLAVVRGIRRAILMNRAVRVNSQLTSHKRFANAFKRYCNLVDNARLYSTNSVGGPPRMIAWKDGENKVLVDPDEIKCLTIIGSLNPDAESIYELHGDPNPIFEQGSVWKDIVLQPERSSIQKELTDSIKRIEASRQVLNTS